MRWEHGGDGLALQTLALLAEDTGAVPVPVWHRMGMLTQFCIAECFLLVTSCTTGSWYTDTGNNL